jgi:hypothetical protein
MVLQVPWNKSGLSSSYSGSSYGGGKASDSGISASISQVTNIAQGDMSTQCNAWPISSYVLIDTHLANCNKS